MKKQHPLKVHARQFSANNKDRSICDEPRAQKFSVFRALVTCNRCRYFLSQRRIAFTQAFDRREAELVSLDTARSAGDKGEKGSPAAVAGTEGGVRKAHLHREDEGRRGT